MNDTTIALLIVLVVLVVAATSRRWLAIAVSLVAFVCYNFFVLPPVGTFTIARQDDAVALFTLLAVTLIGSHLSQQARRRAEEAVAMARQRQEAEIARRHAETKSAMVASLSHDLKTPLTALTVAAENLALRELSDGERSEQLDLVRDELARLKRLFEHIGEMASVETQAIGAEREWASPSDIVDAARRQAGSALDSRSIDVDTDTDRLVHLDPRLTSAALAHVLENAAAYSPAGSTITIEVRLVAETLVLRVRDRGPGLAPEELDRVFQRFYRGPGAGDRFGTGMGLAITRGLVTLQGGRVTASNHPEGGAVFTIEIPVSSRPAEEASADLA